MNFNGENMFKSISYLFHRHWLKKKMNQDLFLIYSEKHKDVNYAHYSEFVYLLVKDRLIKLHLQYGEVDFSYKDPHYTIMDNSTIKNHRAFTKVIKKGKATTKNDNLIHHILRQEKRLNKRCYIMPFVSSGIVVL